MRLLLDANLSPKLVEPLTIAGYEAIHVLDVGLLRAKDDAIFKYAADVGCVVVTADSDFPMMLALQRTDRPSVVLLRHIAELPCHKQGDLLAANLPLVEKDLRAGAIVSLSPARLAVRDLPMQ
ncbi:DUF5615 family PIN-like protein [Arthrobacter castelli]|uniref:DUF5615 family PIN-like protein n=1 Tax=Arthrobacter castelli TaxID=271431 RepID=UPI00042421A4|nr:DUF5615 family PIN-like protein [Arthrobacter castelli]